MKKLIKILIILACLFVVALVIAAIGASYFIGDIIKKGVEMAGPKVTQVDVKLGSASLSLLGGSGSISGLVVANPQGYKSESAIKVGKASLGIAPGSLLSDKIIIKSIQLHEPEITLEGSLKDNNLTQIQKNIEAFLGSSGAAPKDTSAKPTKDQAAQGPEKKLQVDDVLVRSAKVNAIILGKTYNLTIPDIHITNLGQEPQGITAGTLTKRLVNEILNGAVTALVTNVADVGKLGKDLLQGTSQEATKTIEKATEGLGSLLKKK